LEFVKTLEGDGVIRPDVEHLEETTLVVVWFIAIVSIIVHGLSIPLGKLGYYLPRTLSRGLNTPNEGGDGDNTPPFSIGTRVSTFIQGRASSRSRRNSSEEMPAGNTAQSTSARAVYRIGGAVIPKRSDSPSLMTRRIGTPRNRDVQDADAEGSGSATPVTTGPPARTIRFPDEELTTPQADAAQQAELKKEIEAK